jgi:hypothetical protein
MLLLAAVFSMHGIACTADDHPIHAGRHLDPASIMAVADPVHDLGASSRSAAAHGTATPGDGTSTLGAAVLLDDGSDRSSSVAGDLWALCLGVVAAGIGLVSFVLARRRGRASLPHRSRSGRGWPAVRGSPPRPPSLSSLCVLRI